MEKKVYELKIRDSLEHVMPPLQSEELDLLTQSLLSEGCRDPLVVWNGVIVDGHNRYRICWRHGIPFSYVEMNFGSESEAVMWSIRNQAGRRNLTPFQRCEMVLLLEENLKAEAKKRQGHRSDLDGRRMENAKCTADILAEMAGVSHSTLHMAKKVLIAGDAEVIRNLRNGQVSIHAAYKMWLKKSEMTEEKDTQTENHEKKRSCNLSRNPISGESPVRNHDQGQNRSQLENPLVLDAVCSTDPMSDTNNGTVNLMPIKETVHTLLDRITEGEATTKMIIAELTSIAQMIDEAMCN